MRFFQVNVADHSGSQWLTCFQDTATEVLGIDAEQLGVLRDTDEAAFDDVFQRANFKDFTFKVRAKMDMFNVSALRGKGVSSDRKEGVTTLAIGCKAGCIPTKLM